LYTIDDLGTHLSDNGSGKQEENVNMGLGVVSDKFVWQNIG
jgi:hypothetical protein